MTVLLSRRDCLKARLSAARARPSRAKPRFGGRASARLLRAEHVVLFFEGKGNHVFGLAFFRHEQRPSETPNRQSADPELRGENRPLNIAQSIAAKIELASGCSSA